MWRFTNIYNPRKLQLWLSDGQPLHAVRGGQGVSARLIVQDQGFLDVTELDAPRCIVLDANGVKLWHECCQTVQPRVIELDLELLGDGDFSLRIHAAGPRSDALGSSTSGRLKPLPTISKDDVEFIDSMIKADYVPYRNMVNGQGKSRELIISLGQRLFPFTPYSFELAMCVYDWTTASFTRMVLMKIFEYTAYTGAGQPPTPVDQHSIAEQIWKSNWPPFTAQDPDFMRSFMMKPSWSLLEVELQLKDCRTMLHRFSNVENRLLAAAIEALPRPSVLKKPRLFSGQVDIQQLGRDHFGIEFLECPVNKGPICEPLTYDFSTAMSTYVSRTITTKMVWSFTDNIEDAMHYSNGILLIADFPEDSWVWDNVAYITPLSDDSEKTEYIFTAGSRFEVKSVEKHEYNGKHIDVITLQLQPRRGTATGLPVPAEVRELLPKRVDAGESLSIANADPITPAVPHSMGRTGGRRCGCIRD